MRKTTLVLATAACAAAVRALRPVLARRSGSEPAAVTGGPRALPPGGATAGLDGLRAAVRRRREPVQVYPQQLVDHRHGGAPLDEDHRPAETDPMEIAAQHYADQPDGPQQGGR